MAERLVKCIKFGTELPGLDTAPVPSDLGKKVYENVSKQAWQEFLDYFKMVVNEYRLDLTSPMADQVFEQKIQEYFFSENYTMPEGFTPERG